MRCFLGVDEFQLPMRLPVAETAAGKAGKAGKGGKAGMQTEGTRSNEA